MVWKAPSSITRSESGLGRGEGEGLVEEAGPLIRGWWCSHVFETSCLLSRLKWQTVPVKRMWWKKH